MSDRPEALKGSFGKQARYRTAQKGNESGTLLHAARNSAKKHEKTGNRLGKVRKNATVENRPDEKKKRGSRRDCYNVYGQPEHFSFRLIFMRKDNGSKTFFNRRKS